MSLTDPSVVKAGISDLLGRSLHDLRISVIDNCNLRCRYCMPLEKFGEGYAFLPESELLTFDEIERLTRLFVELGARKVRVTGGEPLLRKELPALIRRLADVDGVEDIALTTNGLLLRQHARALRDAGLDRLTVSLDSIDDEIFGQMNGRGVKVSHVLEGIEAAKSAGFESIKINAVIQKGVNDHEVLEMAEHFRDSGCILRFIEYMDVGNRNRWRSDQVFSARDIINRIDAKYPLRPGDKNYTGEVASRYLYEDGSGEIGVVSSVTETFCSGCTRARLSADGRLYTCLFAQDGTDLRSALRSGVDDGDMLRRLQSLWETRDDRYSEQRASLSDEERHQRKVEMYEIGG